MFECFEERIKAMSDGKFHDRSVKFNLSKLSFVEAGLTKGTSVVTVKVTITAHPLLK